jgi:BRCT domain, a BRCA1 C-terminus domain
MAPPSRAPKPTRTFFDPFNSSSTGHQRAENRLSGSTSWRESRSYKLAHQLRDSSGCGGDAHLADLVGAGTENFGKDGRKENVSWEVDAPGLREKGWQDIRGLMGRTNKRKSDEGSDDYNEDSKRRKQQEYDVSFNKGCRTNTKISSVKGTACDTTAATCSTNTQRNSSSQEPPKSNLRSPQIFRSLTLYLNGSTHSSGVSDHRLKSLFVQHGGSISISLGRRTVTHVILGSNCGSLAAGKIEKEVKKVGGKGVKYVTAKWVVDSVENGKRLPESRYQAVHTALKGQRSVQENLTQAEKKQPQDVS